MVCLMMKDCSLETVSLPNYFSSLSNAVIFFPASCDDPLGGGLNTNDRLTHTKLWITQFYALLVKRVHYTKGKIVALLVQNLLPLLVITFSLFIARYLQRIPDPPPLELSPQLFFAKSHYNYLFTGGYYTNETAPMIDSLFRPCGIAAHSLGSATDKESKCYLNSTKKFDCPSSDYPQQQYSCSCAMCNQSVPAALYDSSPPCYNGTCTGSRVLNLTLPYDPLSPDIGYAALHEYLLRSRDSFIEQRYGGVSFGHVKEDVPATVDELNSDQGSLPFLATHSAAKVWYTLKGYHAMPSYLNTMNNAILRGSLGSPDDQPEYGEIISPGHIAHLSNILYIIYRHNHSITSLQIN